ncbi:unnamed protein product, partial [Mesorhabditis belari]|uniref:Secreted protein n=1 Tax=Mesorhabditis belari TaxID=2138241 RepID=A0AAF3ENC2_9BILA
MNTLLFACSLPVALAALVLFFHNRHRKRQKIVKATTYRPPPQSDPYAMTTMPSFHHQSATHLSIHQLSSEEKAPPMDPQNANIDRLAPNDRRLAPVQLPVICSAPPPYEAVVC